MELIFKELTQLDAYEIANWRYEGIYSFYNMDFIPEDLKEFLNEEMRTASESNYYVARNQQGEIIGFIELLIKNSMGIIGLGLKPELTGRGIGYSFLTSIIDFIKLHYTMVNKLKMSVVDFNQRAINVYKKVGFKEDGKYTIKINNQEYHFIRLMNDTFK